MKRLARSHQLTWPAVLTTLLLSAGCAGWHRSTEPARDADEVPATAADPWRPRVRIPGGFGVDARAREIERNLGIH